MSTRIKGQAFIGFLATLRRLRGTEDYERVLKGLPPDAANAIATGAVVTVGWYPIAWYTALHASARAVCGAGISRVVGREATRSDLTTIYRFVLRFLAPDTMLAQSERIFGLFCDGGKCISSQITPTSGRLTYSDCVGASRGMWELVLAGTELIIELCGGKTVTSKVVSGGGDGESSMIAQFTWTR